MAHIPLTGFFGQFEVSGSDAFGAIWGNPHGCMYTGAHGGPPSEPDGCTDGWGSESVPDPKQ